MKKSLLLIFVTLIFLSYTGITFAEVASSSASDATETTSTARKTKLLEKASKMTTLEAKSEDLTDKRITNLKERANREIDRRISSLTDLATRINNLQKLTTEQKSAMTDMIQKETTNLTALKTKIAADTDLATLKIDVKSIVTSYRIYALLIPQIHILAGADAMQVTADKLDEIATKLEKRLQEAQIAGNDVTILSAALVDMKNKIAESDKQYDAIIAAVTPLTADGYPGNKSTLKNARKMLQIGRAALVVARKDAKEIMQGLHKLKLTKSSSLPEEGDASGSAMEKKKVKTTPTMSVSPTATSAAR